MTPFVPKDVRVGRENDAVVMGVFLRGGTLPFICTHRLRSPHRDFFPYLNPSTLLEEGR